ncbi:hypothetical protein BBJ28_00009291 [Nothophytophthora sp. Chile5]|nr:hypothetical protein BBJ28_00009291 [Nothophytophthora sp. Chile5]
MGFRSLIEWMTAESLLARPDDPLTFIQALLQEKIGEVRHVFMTIRPLVAMKGENKQRTMPSELLYQRKGGEKFQAEHTLAYIKQCYAAARFEALPRHFTVALTCSIDHQGVAGTVAATGRAVNISDAYADPNFDSQYDQRNGYQTRSMLCVPVRNGDNNIVGVMQVLNKISIDKTKSFTDEDEEILTILASQAGVALSNADTHAMACIARERVKEVLSIVQDMHRDLGFISLMFTISTRIQKFVNSDRCTLYIVDRTKNELWTLQGEVNIRVPINQGIAGAVAQCNESINLANAYDDPRFNKDFDQKHGYQTRSVLAMPLRNEAGEVTAVVQLINKLDSSGIFTSDDEELLGTFLQIAGPILYSSHSHLPKPSGQSKDEVGTEFSGKSTRGQDVIEMNVISENDEEET